RAAHGADARVAAVSARFRGLRSRAGANVRERGPRAVRRPVARAARRRAARARRFHLRTRAAGSSALGALLVRNDGAAEADRPRPRRYPGGASEEHRARAEPLAREPDVLLHDDRLDDVQRAAFGVAAGIVGGAVRRASRVSGAGAAGQLAADAEATSFGASPTF